MINQWGSAPDKTPADSYKPEIIKIGQSSHKMYSNNIVNFQESRTILNACTKKSENLWKTPHMYCK